MTEQKRRRRLPEAALVLSLVGGGAVGNIFLIRQGTHQIGQYLIDNHEAQAAQTQANNIPDPLTIAYAKRDHAIDDLVKDEKLYSDNSRNMRPEEQQTLSLTISKDQNQVDQRVKELDLAQENRQATEHSEAQNKAWGAENKAENSLDDIRRAGLELAFLNTAIALGSALLVKKRKMQKREQEDIYLARCEAEINQYMRESPSR